MDPAVRPTVPDPSSSTAADAVIVLTTVPSDHDGVAMGRQLVEEGLAACVNVLPPMVSVYRWQGAVHQDMERQLVIKTRAERVEALMARLQALHPYDVPECLVLPIVGGSRAYLDWLRDAVSVS